MVVNCVLISVALITETISEAIHFMNTVEEEHAIQTNLFVYTSSGRSKGGALPPTAENVLNFMQFYGNFLQNRMLVPPLEGWRPS